jgi:branched-chain amino acid transport system permease protein
MMARVTPLRVLAAAAIVLAVLVPTTAPDYVISLATLMMITALLAVSVNMLAGEVGLVSMGHAGIAAAAAYGVAWASRHDMGAGGQLGLALVVTLLVTAVYAVTTMRTDGLVFLMITLALGVMIFGLALKWSTVTGGQSGLTGIHRPDLVDGEREFYGLVLVLLLLSLLLLRQFARSPLGLMLRGVRDSQSRMSSLGYSIAPAKFVAVMVSGVVAGVAGVLGVWNAEFMSPSAASFERSAMAVVIIIIGGIGAMFGPLLGAGLVVGISHWLSSYLERWPTLLGALFIAVVIFMPAGIVGFLKGTRRSTVSQTAPALRALLHGRGSRRTATASVGEHVADHAPSPADNQKGQEVDQK